MAPGAVLPQQRQPLPEQTLARRRSAVPPGEELADASQGRHQRWQLVLPERTRMLALARTSGCTADAAHDVVHDAFLRVITHQDVDPHRLVALLVTTVRHLAIDQHRREQTQHRLTQHQGLAPRPVASPEDHVCDIGYSRWVHQHLHLLRPRERHVLLERSRGQTPAHIAQELGITIKAVESITHRARSGIRHIDETRVP